MGHLEAAASVHWSGWEGTITGQSGTLSAPTATQAELGGPGTGTNPEELLAAAHANCFTSTLTSLGRARGVALQEVTTRAKTRLEWDDDAHDHHLAGSELSVTIRTSSPEDEVRALVRETEERCPVCRAIAGNVPMRVSLEVQSSP